MIPMKYIRKSLEKNSAFNISNKDKAALKMLGAAGKLISSGAKLFVRHPIASTLGVGAVIGGGVLASKILPTFTIVNEMSKRNLMKDQIGYLQQMASTTNAYGKNSDINPQQDLQPAVAPLA